MKIYDVLSQYAHEHPENMALICSQTQRSLNYQQLNEHCNNYSQYLQTRGIKTGNKILILQGMSLELYIALLAIFRIGAIAVFIDPSQPPAFIKRCIKETRPDALFASRKIQLLSWLWPVRWLIPTSLNCKTTLTATSADTDFQPTDFAGSVPALMTFTSGSTGQPKVIVRSQQFLFEQLAAITPHIDLKPGQKDLCTMPVFILANLANGLISYLPACDVRHPARIKPQAIFQQLKQHQIERIGASPALFETLLASTDHAPDSLRGLYTGGAPVLPTLMQRLQQWAPKAKVVAVYGSSEAEPISRIELTEITPDDLQAMKEGKGLLAGKPVPEIKVTIIQNNPDDRLLNISAEYWQHIQQPLNHIGEIVVSGHHVLPGYLNGRGDNENKINAENRRWHRTGDSGFLDEQGRLWLTGRCKAVITDRLGKLYPFTVETAAAMAVPTLTLSACVRINNKRYLFAENITEEQKDQLNTALSWAKLAGIHSVKKLPVDKRHNAKVDYTELKNWLTKK